MKRLFLTKLPHLNVVVIRQVDDRTFVSVPDSIIIDREGLLHILEGLLEINFISQNEISNLMAGIGTKDEN